MEDLVDELTRGNVPQVKTALASIVLVLAAYQVLLMAVGWGKVRVPFLSAKAASFTHRAAGDAIVVVTFIVAFMCLAYFGIEDGIEYAADGETFRATLHVISGSLLLIVLVFKIIVVRWWHAAGKYLPPIGLTVFTLFVIAWLTSAGDYLWGG